MMKWLPVFCYLGVGAWEVGANSDLLFPSDPAKREALQECFMENHQFNPLDQGARARCFEARLRPSMPQMAQMPPQPQANFVDLWRSYGQGPMSGNDIRRQSMTR